MQHLEQSLNGIWQLSGRMESGLPPRIFSDAEFTISAAVPGNIELDLFNSKLIDDPYVKCNAMALRKYEFYEWLYTREFEYDGVERNIELIAEGLDCCAEIFCNGQSIGSSANALIPHRFNLTGALRNGLNVIAIHISSANNVFRKFPYEASVLSAYPYNYESTRIRKPAHAWGWDITPRMALGGIFRNITLKEVPAYRIEDDFLQVSGCPNETARMFYGYKIEVPEYSFDDLEMTLDGHCEESVFHAEEAVWSAQGVMQFYIDHPRLWWPRHYGKADLYEVTACLRRKSTGAILAEHKFNTGIRSIKLQAKPVWTESPEPDFQFIVNNVPVRLFGCNHVPADALHSQDEPRLQKILDMACELECNMIRIWGGGIYESDAFYDRCDREGIMLWQDFMMGCANYPQDGDLQQIMQTEAESVVRRLRQHPSIALWAGDNECDCLTTWGFPLDANKNVLTRQILPDVCRRQDPTRIYLPSSPWYSPEAVQRAEAHDNPDAMFESAEQHLWGPRDYFKSDFYRNTHASFVSEIGYHGCPSVSSIKQFVSPENLWPFANNQEWNYHASNPFMQDHSFLNYRTDLMARQIKEMFGVIPDTLEKFAIASQICQAEAKKFFLELARSRRKFSGLLWWNLCDCWPQFSDAVCDYYFNKKLAYYYIKRLQQPFLIMLPEPACYRQSIIACNDSNSTVSGRYSIYDAENDQEFAAGDFDLAAGTIKELSSITVCTTDKKLLLIKWQLTDNTTGCNHALCGNPQFDLDKCVQYLEKIAQLDNSFNPAKIAK